MMTSFNGAVRQGTCDAGTNTVAGNVDGFDDSYSWDGNMFSAPFDAELFDEGQYCFIFNPKDDGEVDVRETVTFSIEHDDEGDGDGGDNGEPTDLCSNVDGIQTEVPVGQHRTEGGECVNDGSSTERSGPITLSVGTAGNRATGGQVLGAFSGGSCGMYLFDYMKEGMANNPSEVEKLQSFLNEQGYSLPVTGIFGSLTDKAVRSFQASNKTDVLVPWAGVGFGDGETPTGYVYKTTRWKINNIVCPGSETLPVLP